MAEGVGARATARVRAAVPARNGDGGARAAAKRAVRDRLDGVLPVAAYPTTPWAARLADGDYGQPATPDWREIDWRRHIHDVQIDGRNVRYVDVGEGDAPPVVFVHGLGGNWQNWLENLPAAAQGRRALALDLPGFGMSETPAADISISEYAGTIVTWLDRLGVTKVVLVGNSMGGFVAAEVGIRTDLEERLVLVAAAGISQTSLRRRPTMTAARIAMAVGALTASRSRDVIVRDRLRHVVMSTIFRYPARMRADILYEVLQGSGKPGFVDALDALTSYDFRDRLGEIDCPTLVIWGREDVIVPQKDGDEYERLIPQARQVVMDDTGHVPMLERPAAFNRCLAEFMAEGES